MTDLKYDLISRQAAIDAIEQLDIPEDMCVFEILSHIELAIGTLPSAQPTITCDGCRFVGTYDTDFPCCSCIRREKDYYEPER